jgi:U4/U6 small nuclear ribonucleoprotein PRP3
MNAIQYHLGGFCFIADQNTAPDLPNLVLVEGGPRAIKKYKKLMLRRIKWNEKSKHPKNHLDENDEENKEPENDAGIEANFDELDIKVSKDRKCFLIWEGIVKKK